MLPWDKIDRTVRLLAKPQLFEGAIVKGFQRGRQLGFKTANLDPACYKEAGQFVKKFHQQVMLGFCVLRPSPTGSDRDPYPCVLSLGDNPYFQNEETTIEVHIP